MDEKMIVKELIEFLNNSDTVEQGLALIPEIDFEDEEIDLEKLLVQINDVKCRSIILIHLIDQKIDKTYQGESVLDLELPFNNEGYQWLYHQITKLCQDNQGYLNITRELLVEEYLLVMPTYYAKDMLENVLFSLMKEGFLLLKSPLEWYDYVVRKQLKGHEIKLKLHG